MNHQKIYDNLIKKVKSEYRVKYKGIYYENHHIIPRCLSGVDTGKKQLPETIEKIKFTLKERYNK